MYGSWKRSNWLALSKYGVVTYGSLYCPYKHRQPSSPGYAAAHASPSRAVAFTSVKICCVSFSRLISLDGSSGSMSTHSALSKKPSTGGAPAGSMPCT